MRAFQIFGAMKQNQAEALFREIAEQAPGSFTQAVYAAASTFKSRPQFLIKQPFPKRVSMVRRALAQVNCNTVSEEMLAIYFLECKKDVLIEWLDGLGIEHEEGSLREDNPEEPDADKLQKAIDDFRAKDDDPDRDLLLKAFASQSAIEWPKLDAFIEGMAS
jgi:hypothetical protein